MSVLSRSARRHRIERRLQIAGPVAVIVTCVIAVVVIIIHFRLALP